MFHRHAIERLNVNLSDWVTAMFFLLQTLQVFGSHNGRLFILRSKYGPNFWIVLFPFRLYLLLALRKLALITLFFAWTCYVRKQNTSLDLQTEALRFPLCFVQTCSKTRSRRSNLKSHFTSVQVLISPLSFLQIWIFFSFFVCFYLYAWHNPFTEMSYLQDGTWRLRHWYDCSYERRFLGADNFLDCSHYQCTADRPGI